jgi:cyanobactin maturation PatA/PatG family protease
MSDQKQAGNDVSNLGGAASTEVANVIASGLVAAEHLRDPGGPDMLALGISSSAPAIIPSEVQAAECTSCKEGHGTCKTCAGGDSAGPALAYVLGQIGYDFPSESRRDQFVQLANINPYDPQQLLDYLAKDPASAASVTWTLSLDSTVVYVVVPFGPFAIVAYERLREALAAQISEGAERLSVPGYVKGSTNLLNGQAVPVLYADLRGIFSWSTPALVKATVGTAPKEKKATSDFALQAEGVQNFLERIYYEVRNLGITPQERAMNYAATNAFQLEFIFKDAVLSGMKLDGVDVERSPICRPGSDCWDVKLTFFNPSKRIEQARHVYRFTVDVSEVIPVTVGKVRHWDIY